MTTPAQVVHVGADTRDPTPPPEGSLGTTLFPRLTVLWNGVPLEMLGLAEHLLDAEFTSTIGRTKATTRQPTGKPKIGGAKLTFQMIDDEAAGALIRMLIADKNPVITVAFGYDDSASYWTGQVRAAKKPDSKLFGQVRGFKMDTVTQENDAGVRRLVINGMVDRAMALCENTKPRVFEGKTPRQILDLIAKEYDVDIQIDDDVPADERMAHMIKAAGSNDMVLLTQVTDRMGANITFGQVGAADAYGTRDKNASGRETIDRSRTLLRISSMGSFYDVSRIEASRPVVIGYGPGSDSGRRGKCDFLAKSIRVQASHFTPRSAVAAGTTPSGKTATGTQKKSRDDRTSTHYETMDENGNPISEQLEMVGGLSPEASQALHSSAGGVEIPGLHGNLPRDAATGALAVGALFGSPVAVAAGAVSSFASLARGVATLPQRVLQRQTAIDLSGNLTSEQLRAAAIAAGQVLRLTVEMFPGLPHLQPTTPVRIVGTPGHDGIYVVEETRLSFSKAGLSSTHELAPMANLKGGKKSAAQAAAAQAAAAAARRDRAASDDYRSIQYETMDENGNPIVESLEMVGGLSKEASETLRGSAQQPTQTAPEFDAPESVDGADGVPDTATGEP